MAARSGGSRSSGARSGPRSGGVRTQPVSAGVLDPAAVAAVARILDRLPGMERRVVELRFGLSGGHPVSVADVAAQLRLTVREVAEIERRGLVRLRTLLDPALLSGLLARFGSSAR